MGLRGTPDGRIGCIAYYNPADVTDGIAQQLRIADGAVEAEWVVPGSPRVTCPALVEIAGGRSGVHYAVEGCRLRRRRPHDVSWRI